MVVRNIHKTIDFFRYSPKFVPPSCNMQALLLSGGNTSGSDPGYFSEAVIHTLVLALHDLQLCTEINLNPFEVGIFQLRGEVRQTHRTDAGGGRFYGVRPTMQIVAGRSQRTVFDITEKLVYRLDVGLDDHARIVTHILPEALDYLIVQR